MVGLRSRGQKLDCFGKLMAGDRRRPERSIKEGRNESGRNEHQERNAEIYRFGLQGET